MATTTHPDDHLTVMLLSGGQMEEFPLNTKSKFSNRMMQPTSLPGTWECAVSQITVPKDIINFVSETDEGETEDGTLMDTRETAYPEYEADSVGGVRTPYQSPDGDIEEYVRPDNTMPVIHAALEASMLVRNARGQWFEKTNRESIPFCLEPNADHQGYSAKKAASDINEALKSWVCLNKSSAPAPPVTPGDEVNLTVFSATGQPLHPPIPLFRRLARHLNFNDFLREYLMPYVKYVTQDTVLFRMSRGRITVQAPPGTKLIFTAEKAMQLSTMYRHMGLNPNSSETEFMVPRNGILTLPSPPSNPRLIPEGIDILDYSDFTGLKVKVSRTQRNRVDQEEWDVNVHNLMMASSPEDFLSMLWRPVLGTTTFFDDDGRFCVSGASNNSYYVTFEGQGCPSLRHMLGLSCVWKFSGDIMHPHETCFSNLYFESTNVHVPTFAGGLSGPRYNSHYGMGDTIANIRGKWTAPTPANLPLLTEDGKEYCGDYVEVTAEKDKIHFTMKKGGLLHGFLASVTHSNRAIGAGARILISCNERPIFARQPNEVMARPLLTPPPITNIDYIRVAVDNYAKDTRDLRRDHGAAAYVRCYKSFPVKEDVSEDNVGNSDSVALLEVIRFPVHMPPAGSFKTPKMLMDSLYRSFEMGLRKRAMKWRTHEEQRLGSQWRAEMIRKDVLIVLFNEPYAKFSFKCGDSFDYVEVALSPSLAGLMGFPLGKDALLRIHRGVAKPGGFDRVEGMVINYSAGQFWLRDPTYGGLYETESEILLPYPVNLTLGINEIFLRLSCASDRNIVAGQNTRVVGMLTMDLKGGDTHYSPSSLQWVDVKNVNMNLEVIQAELLDYMQRPIKFRSNDMNQVIIVLWFRKKSKKNN